MIDGLAWLVVGDRCCGVGGCVLGNIGVAAVCAVRCVCA